MCVCALSCSSAECLVFVSVFDLVWFFFFKQKTAYEMRISDWSSDVCSSDLTASGLSSDIRHRRRFRLHRLHSSLFPVPCSRFLLSIRIPPDTNSDRKSVV